MCLALLFSDGGKGPRYVLHGFWWSSSRFALDLVVCCVASQRCVVVMAEQQVDCPPNKKQKVVTPSTPTDNEGMY